jgi:hypothetical protein
MSVVPIFLQLIDISSGQRSCLKCFFIWVTPASAQYSQGVEAIPKHWNKIFSSYCPSKNPSKLFFSFVFPKLILKLNIQGISSSRNKETHTTVVISPPLRGFGPPNMSMPWKPDCVHMDLKNISHVLRNLSIALGCFFSKVSHL